MQIKRQPVPLNRRAGLAPLEFVLNLPIMLFVMALMIIFGTAGAWKVRAHANARQAAWRAFWPRTGNNDPNPSNWPQSAPMSYNSQSPSIFPGDPYAEFPVVRGPVLIEPESGKFLPIRNRTLDMTAGLSAGYARIRRDYPIFKRLPPHEIDFPRHHLVFDGSRWQFGTMGMWANLTRRVLFTYDVDLQGRIVGEVESFLRTAVNMLQDPRRPHLVPLRGGDPEIANIGGGRSPNFVPGIGLGSERGTISPLRGRSLRPRLCNNDPEMIRQDQVRPLIDRIENVPRRMTQYYISAYESAIRRLENADPRPPGASQQIAQWRQYVNQLRSFQSQLSQ